MADHDNIDATKHKAADVFRQVARENSFNPVKTYLEVVSKNVTPISLDNLSSRYFGTSDPLYDSFLKKTLIGAVARTYEPGCKNDTALVLQGKQGIYKSTFLRVLGGEWFDDSMGDGRNKDDLIILHKCWIQEWGEIERVFGKRQAGELKAFITRQTDTFRQPYAMTASECPRRSIIVGSVNDSQFLVDPTGNRRYWVIPIKVKRINIHRLKQERDAIWAAALSAYRSGEPWWLSPDEEELSTANNQQFQIVDEWESPISNYIELRQQVSITEILTNVFNYELGKIDRSSQMRVSTILTSVGWKKVGRKQHQGRRQIVWQPGIPAPLAPGMPEVCQAENITPIGIDIPGTPGIPSNKVILKSENSKNPILNTLLETNDSQGMPVCQSQSGQGIKPDTQADTPPKKAGIPWKTYPYSGNQQARQQRANKVKERILNCQTDNELIKLLANGQVSQVEMDWLKNNLLTSQEIEQLETILKTHQGNLLTVNELETNSIANYSELETSDDEELNSSSSDSNISLEWNTVINEIDECLKKLDWSTEDGKNYLNRKYGVKSRHHLSDEEIIEFMRYLQDQLK